MSKVLLLSMPFGALDRPALGLSLLSAALARLGIGCDVRYLTYPFAELIGLDEYRLLTSELPYTAFAGDWTFTEALHGPRPGAVERYVEEILRGTHRLSDALIGRILRVRARVPHFLEYCRVAVPWDDYAVVGFTSTFEQNLASLALARQLEASHPQLALVFGGANWEGEMGVELHARYPFVDYVCQGEADQSFPALAQRLVGPRASGDSPALASIPGVLHREGGQPRSTGAAVPVRNLDDLPVPDFGAFFEALEGSTIAASIVPTLLFEAARGCWWGAKSHCTFCGLNGGAMAFRSKSAARAEAELRALVARWGAGLVSAVDNILDMRYFDDFLPALARVPTGAELFYEVKANLSREHVRLLSAAGVRRIQPGIESLSDHVLGLMRKGTTALQNVQLLKWCQEEGVDAEWNLLYGFPGERDEDYHAMLGLLGAIRFLRPPVACGPLRLDRFSPYHSAPADYGLANVRALATYRHLYPFDEEALRRIAYYFDFDYGPGSGPSAAANEVIRFVQAWQQQPGEGELRARVEGDGLVLEDTRPGGRARRVCFRGIERAVYELCDEARSPSALLRALRERFPGRRLDEARVRAFLERLVELGLMLSDGRRFLALALGGPALGANWAAAETRSHTRAS